MKKLFLIFIVAGSLVACNNAGDTGQKTLDSLDSSKNLQKESIDAAAQDAKKNIDSTTQAVKDSVGAALNRSQDTTNRK
jgi:hypothetical protein